MRIIGEDEYQTINKKMVDTDCFGMNGHIYRLDNLAIKMFLEPIDITDTVLRQYKILSELKTKRFVMPKDIICKCDQIIGLTTSFIEDKKEPLNNLNMNLLSNELKIIKEDLKLLNDNRIMLIDCHEGNLLFKNGIYIIDTQSYEPLEIYQKSCNKLVSPERSQTLKNYNLFRINNAIINFLSNRLSGKLYHNSKTDFVLLMYDEIKQRGGQDETYIGDIIEEDKMDNQNFKQYVQKKTKRI